MPLSSNNTVDYYGPMASLHRSTWELSCIGVIVVIAFGFFLNAFLYNREVVRDDIRRDDLTNLKHALEAYYNVYNVYPTSPQKTIDCTFSNDPQSWFFGNASPLFKAHVIDALPHDLHESTERRYAYCVTALDGTGNASGYYLEASLEVDAPDAVHFDEDEDRKFHYRIVHDHGVPFIRVCGGEEHQCQPLSES